MDIELDPSLTPLLQDGAPSHVILQQWQNIYNDDSSVCYHVLACFAVHYKHGEILDHLLQNPYYRQELLKSCAFSPLITAVHQQDANYCEKIGKIRLFYMDIKARGIINGDNQLVMASPTALDMIMRRNDAQLMMTLLPHCYSGVLVPFLTLAKQSNAYGCYLCIAAWILLDYDFREDLQHLSPDLSVPIYPHPEADLRIVQRLPWIFRPQMIRYPNQQVAYANAKRCANKLWSLIQFMCCASGKVTRLQYESICCWWVLLDVQNQGVYRIFHVQFAEWAVRHIASGYGDWVVDIDSHLQDVLPLEKIIDFVARSLRSATQELKRSQIKIHLSTYPYFTASTYTNVILEVCLTLLSKMHWFMVPKYVFIACLHKIKGIYLHSCFGHDAVSNNHVNTLITLNIMSVLFLFRKIDSDFVCQDASGNCDCWTVSETLIISDYLTRFKDLTSASYNPTIHRHIHKHLMILLAYGYAKLADLPAQELFGFRVTHMITNITHTIISLLPHDNFEAYRLMLMAKKQEYKEESEMDDDFRDAEKLHQLECDMVNSYDAKGARSLQELCRVKLYDDMGTALMWKILSPQCGIPQHLQDFITLDERNMFEHFNHVFKS